jgi:tetratricopeptide (TPR) repeat protein/predicted Ser/Thr protein kinase
VSLLVSLAGGGHHRRPVASDDLNATASTQLGDDSPWPGGDPQLVGAGQEGRRLGRYTLLELLGHGGMGVVYTAYDEALDRKVAVKLLHSAPGDASGRALLLREATALARLAHPNVIHVYEVGENEGRVFLAMEFVRGQNLRGWVKEAERGWPEVVAMLVQAGRGLSAAHQAGLVHCDFKPENVLVGADGRARVLDFGLAYRPGDPSSPQLRGGTPGYMAPEQLSGAPVDARADQFSFCVTLFEALYGQRPFAGATVVALVDQVLRGELRAAPGEARVPTRLRRAVRRGLATDPSARHPSMAALLTELAESLPRPRRRWGIAALGSAIATAALGWVLVREDDPAGRCAATVADEAAALWGEGPRAAVQQAFAATGLAFAQDSFDRSARLLDVHVDAWSRLRRGACERTRGGPARTEADRQRARCLERRRLALAAWIEALTRADAGVVEAAVEASTQLPTQACSEPAAPGLEGGAPVLAEAEEMARAEALLARGRALGLAGQHARGLTPVAEARGLARRLGDRRLEAESLLQQGLLYEYTGEGARAADSLLAAYVAAEAGRHERVRAETAVHLVHVTGGPARVAEVDALWFALAEASAAGLGEGAIDLRASLLQHRSRGEAARGRHEAARRDLEAARELETRRLGAGHPSLAAIDEQLGEQLLALGRLDEALAQQERAVTVTEATLGPEHPSTARRLLARGEVQERRGELRAALADHRRALAIWTRAHGEHPRLIWALTCVGRVLRRLGEIEAAREHYARALAIAARDGGMTEALAAIELADLLRGDGKAGEARTLAARADVIVQAEADRPELVVTLIDLGEAAIADGEPARAIAGLTRAQRLSGERDDQRAVAGFALARAWWAMGEPQRALALARTAESSADAGTRAAIGAWLAGRAGAP